MHAPRPHDPLSAAFTPIHGISLDRYAEVTAALARRGLTDPDEVDAWVTALGVPDGTWSHVHDGWTARMATNHRVRNRYDTLFSRF